MSRQILQEIINDFKVEDFTRFFRSKSDKFQPSNQPLPYENDNFGDGKMLGKITFEDGNLIVCSFQVKQPLSERSGKKAQYELGKRILKETQTDAGIFIFYDQSGNFRFSLIYANYLGRRRDWSTFRRFTYFVSKELTNKTFLQRIGDGDFSSLAKIKEAFSVEKVTKEFYEDIANWYFWAVEHCRFPKDDETEETVRNIAVIRLITRMIFIWFMRERGLVPKELFEEKNVQAVLKDTDPNSATYYQAILQNLFFATLSTKKDERQFRDERRFHKGWNKDFGNQYVFRYHDLFKEPEKMKDYFGNIPFLNGGLFECLDDGRNDIYIDGFTERKKEYQAQVPNFLFFGKEQEFDLNKVYGTKNKHYKVRGLLNIFSSFNFTIDENSPDDADIALDPELLGRVFENLLASFNPETSTTARKATGSYYTPREIVNYMVTESLKEYFKTHLAEAQNIDEKLEKLFSTESSANPFSQPESKKLVDLIENVRIVDPAVGSGAFPMGALNKMVFILNKVDPGNELWKQAQLQAAEAIPDPQVRRNTKEQIEEFFKDKNADYGRKLYLIQKCIYGVDIQQIAVEIAKLRFFISLLVDEKIDKEKENWGIEPLPNLDFKIMQGNSLISEFLGIDFDNSQAKQEQVGMLFAEQEDNLIKEFERKKIDFQNESDKDKKAKLKNEIENLMIKIFETKVRKQKADYFRQLDEIEKKYATLPNKKTREEIIAKEKEKLSQKTGFDLENIEKQLREFTNKNKTKPFFAWKLYFAEVFQKGGFDIVIGNPPYIGEKGRKEIFRKVKQGLLSKFYMGKMDYFYFFFHLSLNIAKDKAVVAFITTNYYPTAMGARNLRLDFKERAIIKNLMNFNELKIFESALGQHNMITILQKSQNQTAIAQTCITQRQGFATQEVLQNILNGEDKETQYYQVSQKDLYDGDEYYIRLSGRPGDSNDPIQVILRKIQMQGVNLESICNVNQGIVTGADKVSRKHIEKYGIKAEIGDGIFVLSDKEISNLKLNKEDRKILKPWFKNSDIFRWGTSLSTTERLIYADKRLHNLENNNLKDYLLKFKKILDDSTVNSPYLHRPRDINFDSKKIVAPQRSPRNTFGYNEIPWYASADVYFITEKDSSVSLKYILTLLNSKLYYIWLYYRGKRKGEMLELYQKPLSEIPIKKIPESEQKPFIDLVDQILAITKDDDYLKNPAKQARVREYEKQIDQLVYKLYNLTPEEIRIVEEK